MFYTLEPAYPVLPTYSARFPDLVKALIYNHCHSDAKENRFKIQKRLTNGLDFDQAAAVIDEADEELSFVHTRQGHVWYAQNEEMLIYVRDQTEMNLQLLSEKFDHLKPPSLAEDYDL